MGAADEHSAEADVMLTGPVLALPQCALCTCASLQWLHTTHRKLTTLQLPPYASAI